ncbi:aminoglycoside phosphotransferase family protein [Parvibium lacunae]|uniref:Aminoglycoside phosphotransferase n=1 Tax=Parvibium lacunae TaxID=1888893 RepID=A0A368L4P0_9BURK|nr:phosphotransferase [Parvibium lacunae]RCS58392.1 aminoglycoside phosphotransferase [Parvibium lacunae]
MKSILAPNAAPAQNTRTETAPVSPQTNPNELPAIDQTARLQLVRDWINTLSPTYQLLPDSLTPASADASFRRYFRVQSQATPSSYIVMDAPPSHEDSRPFIHVRDCFAATGVCVPEIYAQDLHQGLLLLSDFGQTTYLQALQSQPVEVAHPYYMAAIDSLITLQQHSQVDQLPSYNRELLLREMRLFPTWFLSQHHRYALSEPEQNALETIFETLVAQTLGQTQRYVHRDYHSRNLMVRSNETAPGILDFQDAVYGPLTYDLVSLLRDAYIAWPEEQVIDWVIRYWEQAKRVGLAVPLDPSQFYQDFEWMGLQRHLKVLGIFARLYHRDGKAGYLNDLPVVLRYVRKVAERYSAFFPLLKILDHLENVQVSYTF